MAEIRRQRGGRPSELEGMRGAMDVADVSLRDMLGQIQRNIDVLADRLESVELALSRLDFSEPDVVEREAEVVEQGTPDRVEQYEILEYDKFPKIPQKPTLIWCKGHLWVAHVGLTYWRPCDGYTSATGAVGS